MNKKKVLIILFIAIIILFFIISIFPIRIYHWWDETVYLQNAEVLFSGRTNYDEFSFRPPLLSILFAGIFFIWHSPIAASILTTTLCILAPIFIFLIGKKLYNFKTGIIAGLIVCFAPFIVFNSNFLLTDIPAMSFIAISFYFALLHEKKMFPLLSGIFLSLATLMKFTSILLGLVILAYFIINKVNIKKILLFILGAGLVILPYFIWAQLSFGNFLSPIIQGSLMVSDKNEGNMFYLQNISNAFTILPIIGILILILFRIFTINQKKYKNWKIDLILIFWIVIFLIYLTITPHKELRYLFPITIPLIILGANGLSSLLDKLKSKYQIIISLILILFLLYSFVSAIPKDYYKLTNTAKPNEVKASEFITKNYNLTIYSPHNWPVFAYYTNLKTIQLWPYDSSFYYNYNKILEPESILIVTEGINKHPTVEWLNNSQNFKFLEKFGEVYIYKYTA
ncbi:MAG: glycosyltransferase family 39 protein [Candidatus Pacearchaeota archaeon]|jgi:4-amino-4-deoxy-L-arabinose transferase-like glycosyltransferase